LVVGPSHTSRYRWNEECFQFREELKNGVWVLSEQEIEAFWKLAGCLEVPTDTDWLVGNFVREGCLFFSGKELGTGTLTFRFSVSTPQNWHNIHMLIAYKRIFGTVEIAVSSGKTNSSSLVYRCSDPREIGQKMNPV
jgi:hypothetical protein